MLSLLGYEFAQSLQEMGEIIRLQNLNWIWRYQSEEALTDITYEKVKPLRYLEERLEKSNLGSFSGNLFRSIPLWFQYDRRFSAVFGQHLCQHAAKPYGIPVDRWIYNPGLIRYQPAYDNSRFFSVEEQANNLKITLPAALKTKGWSTWVVAFCGILISVHGADRVKTSETVRPGSFAQCGEIAFCWLNYLHWQWQGTENLVQISHFFSSRSDEKFVPAPIYENLVKHGLSEEAASVYRVAARLSPVDAHVSGEILQKAPVSCNTGRILQQRN